MLTWSLALAGPAPADTHTTTYASGGNVRDGDTTCPGTTANPMLGALGDYGGGVQTMPLLPGSPAINAASANCPAVDARARWIARRDSTQTRGE